MLPSEELPLVMVSFTLIGQWRRQRFYFIFSNDCQFQELSHHWGTSRLFELEKAYRHSNSTTMYSGYSIRISADVTCAQNFGKFVGHIVIGITVWQTLVFRTLHGLRKTERPDHLKGTYVQIFHLNSKKVDIGIWVVESLIRVNREKNSEVPGVPTSGLGKRVKSKNSVWHCYFGDRDRIHVFLFCTISHPG